MLLEERERDLFARELPSGGLAAALANLHRQRLGGLGPGTADAGEAARLVLLEKGPAAAEERFFPHHRAGKLAQRRPACRDLAVRLPFHAVIARTVAADRARPDAHFDLPYRNCNDRSRARPVGMVKRDNVVTGCGVPPHNQCRPRSRRFQLVRGLITRSL